jgi:hypothetical protein
MVKRLPKGWTVQESNPSRDKIFRTRPKRSWGPPILLYNGYQVPFPAVKRPGLGVDHPLPSSAEVKERVELYLYSFSGSTWPVIGRTSLLLTENNGARKLKNTGDINRPTYDSCQVIYKNRIHKFALNMAAFFNPHYMYGFNCQE